jgi:hypothetical protein
MKRLLLITTLCFAGAGAASAAPVLFNFSFDTSLLNGLGGFLDFQFNPGGLDAAPLTATVSNFLSTGGVLSPASLNSGDALGTLPAALTLGNSAQLNGVYQGFQFGTALSFDLTIDGAAPPPLTALPTGGAGFAPLNGSTSGTTFGLFLVTESGAALFPTSDPNGSLATVNIDEFGNASAQSFAVVPEPGSMALAAAGLLGAIYFRFSRISSIKRRM